MSDVSLVTGTRGRFEVLVDGNEVFSKEKLDRFPEPGEIARLLEPILGPPSRWRQHH